jgi:hypothetical protein
LYLFDLILRLFHSYPRGYLHCQKYSRHQKKSRRKKSQRKKSLRKSLRKSRSLFRYHFLSQTCQNRYRSYRS